MNEMLVENQKLPSLYCIHFNQCDIKKCTALKLSKLGLLKIKRRLDQCPINAIILDPFSDMIISTKDHDAIARYGLIVIDCSWETTDSFFTHKFRTGRKLPHLLAANTINYGKWDKLSSAEAVTAALFLTGFEDEAKNVLESFSWGLEFFKINQLLEKKSQDM
jgi:pre-rRNA-processing protein TSR3